MGEYDTDSGFKQLRRWIGVGDVLQVGVLLAVIAAGYSRQGARIDNVSNQAVSNASSIAQLHEAIDAVRWTRDATPEAERRIALVEQRVLMLENDRMEFKRDVASHLSRIEDKVDRIAKGVH